MKEKETVPVYICVVAGKTVCVCPRSKKKCKRHCQPDTLERDRFRGWENTFRRDKYGNSE